MSEGVENSAGVAASSAIAGAVVIGASFGAVEALSGLLPQLPETFPFPVIVVVHLPPDRKSMLASLFQPKCRLDVHEAEDKEPLHPATIYFAPPDYHLLIEPDYRLSLSSEEPVLYSRPSIDVLFESAADAYGPGLIGIVLSGANHDGSQGLRAIEKNGGTSIVQDPRQAQSGAMPQSALEACEHARVMTLDEIAAFLQTVIRHEPRGAA